MAQPSNLPPKVSDFFQKVIETEKTDGEDLVKYMKHTRDMTKLAKFFATDFGFYKKPMKKISSLHWAMASLPTIRDSSELQELFGRMWQDKCMFLYSLLLHYFHHFWLGDYYINILMATI